MSLESGVTCFQIGLRVLELSWSVENGRLSFGLVAVMNALTNWPEADGLRVVDALDRLVADPAAVLVGGRLPVVFDLDAF